MRIELWIRSDPALGQVSMQDYFNRRCMIAFTFAVYAHRTRAHTHVRTWYVGTNKEVSYNACIVVLSNFNYEWVRLRIGN